MSVHSPSTLLIKNNRYGINVSTSTFFAQNIEVTDNTNRGISADDGSSVNLSNYKIIDNTGVVYLELTGYSTMQMPDPIDQQLLKPLTILK